MGKREGIKLKIVHSWVSVHMQRDIIAYNMDHSYLECVPFHIQWD
jgi:hypothetical protein